MKPVIENEKLANALTLLKDASKPLPAAEMASRLGIEGGHETQRRRVREIIAELRNGGHWIVANFYDGYWLTADAAMWNEFCEKKMIDGKRMIGEAAKRKKAAEVPAGQGRLFNLNPAACW
jgi:hypothetical protein